MLFDTHCHLDFPVFDAGRDELMQRAAQMGIEQILVPGVELAHFQRVLELQQRWPERIQIALGLHPCFIHQHPANAVSRLQGWLESCDSLCAVGEIGLDARPGMAPEAVQVMFLEAQLKLARELQLPVILHVVKAHERMLGLLRRYALPAGGVVHAYSGSLEQAHQYARLGFKLGFGGAITYARALKQQRLVRELPLEWLLLETDAPDMPLEGFQDQPNTPLQVYRVAQVMAQLRGMPLDELVSLTGETARSLFHKRRS